MAEQTMVANGPARATTVEQTDQGVVFRMAEGSYLGFLSHAGQLSDFRARIINPRVDFGEGSRQSLTNAIRVCIYALLNPLIDKTMFLSGKEREEFKRTTVATFESSLVDIADGSSFTSDAGREAPTAPGTGRFVSMVKNGVRRLGRTAAPAAEPVGPTVDAAYLRDQQPRLSSFRDKHRGKRCFIIGNGPSLNRIDMNYLRDEYTFAVNGFFYKTRETGVAPTFYVVEDNHVIADNTREISDLNGSLKFFPDIHAPQIRDNDYTFFLLTDYGYYREGHPFYCSPRFSRDIGNVIYTGQSVTFVNFQIAYYMGFSEVYLVGMDFHYTVPKSTQIDGVNYHSQEDDPNHFHKDYFGKGKKWHDPMLDRVALAYKNAKSVFEDDGRRIINATVGGKLEIFERVAFSSLF